MQFYAYHGVNPEERSLGQRFLVDVELTTDLRAAGQSDNLADTVNYSTVYKCVRAVVEGEPRHLIESVADAIARELLADTRVTHVTVVVRKPEVALRGSILGAAGVRITRSAIDLSSADGR